MPGETRAVRASFESVTPIPTVLSHPRFSYNVYGVTLRSQWKIHHPEATHESEPVIDLAEGSPELFENFARKFQPGNGRWFDYTRLEDGSDYFRAKNSYELLAAADGRRAVGRSLLAPGDDSFLMYLVGAAISFCLLRYGIEQLHATVIIDGENAFGLLGRSGYGKSTLAGSFLQAGYPILTDDMLVLKREADGLFALPGPSHLKMYRNIARRLFGDRVASFGTNALSRKIVIPLNDDRAFLKPIRLKALYALNPPRGNDRLNGITIQPLLPHKAALQLVQSSFNIFVDDPIRLALQLQTFAQVASHLPVKRISYARRLEQLPAVRDALLNDFATQ
jgi:hypothetical protein